MATRAPGAPAGQAGRVFATTRWTVVLQAGGPTSVGSAAALDELCRTYWYPLYYFARRSGLPPPDAEDLTQSFFTFLLEKNVIARADRDRGRFRSFLLSAFKNFHANERARQSAAKRGGGTRLTSLDEMQAENRYCHEPASDLSPEKLYDQKWAASLLDHVMRILRAEYTSLNKGPLFEVLRRVMLGDGPAGYDALAREAGLTEGAFKVAVHRVRNRFREALRHEVAQTVATPGEVDDELRHLLSALGT
jgi:DNA-directed RNA polymerase specialized sigma24 family protein